MMKRSISNTPCFLKPLLCALLCVTALAPARASTVTSATLSITNYSALTNATSGQKYTINGDARTFTNSLASAATQIRVRTNDSAATILLSIAAQAGSYPFANVPSITASNGTNVTFRATNDTALTITLSPSTWGRVTYSTQTVGVVQTLIRVPMSAEESTARTNNATQLWSDLDAYSQARGLGRVEFSGRAQMDAGLGLHGRGLVTTNYTLSTNDIYLGVDTRSNTNLILTLPSAASASNLLFVLKDEGGSCATNTLKIYPQSGDRIDGLTNLVVSNNFGSVTLRSRGGTNYALLSSGAGVTGTSGGGFSGVTGNTVWVDKINGNDGTGARGTIATPFQTLGAAKAAAASGDTIMVLPGGYVGSDLLKNNVNWHFFYGASVTNNDTTNFLAQFDDFNLTNSVTCRISGDGDFIAGVGGASDSVVELIGTNAVAIDFAFHRIDGGGSVLTLQNGTTTFTGDNIVSSGLFGVTLNNSGNTPQATINRARIQNSNSSANSRAVSLGSASTDLTLRDCVLIGHASATNTINATTAVNVKIYGSLMANKTNGPNVTFTTGAGRFEVDAAVQ